MTAPVLDAIDHAESHLTAPVTVADLAAVANYSLYHFCRVFSRATRHTPHDYLIRRRMTEAAAVIIASDARIIDIALDYQFESHEGFTRAFQRVYGIPPQTARCQHHVPALRRLPRLTGDHLAVLADHDGLVPEIATLPDQRCAAHIALDWPQKSVTEPAATIPGGTFGCFRLHGGWSPLVLDWVLHGWLFYTEYTLRFPGVALEG